MSTTLETRVQEIYTMAFKRASSMLAMRNVRTYPRSRVQPLPDYENEADYEFFRDMTGDCDVIDLNFAEYQVFLVALEKVLADEGIPTKRAMITKREYDEFMAKAESLATEFDVP